VTYLTTNVAGAANDLTVGSACKGSLAFFGKHS
jgi:hypothetical protein